MGILSCFLVACGGGGGATTQTISPVTSSLTFNPAAALEKLYTTDANITSGTTRLALSNGTAEIINGVTYSVQNALTVDANNASVSSKRYYTINPFQIYTPPYYYDVGSPFYYRVIVTLTSQPLPTAVKVGDFGLYETARTETCSNHNTPTGACLGAGTFSEETSIWSGEANTASTIKFCYGKSPNRNLSLLTCYIINSSNTVESFTF